MTPSATTSTLRRPAGVASERGAAGGVEGSRPEAWRWPQFVQRLFHPVDIAPIAYFRIAFGTVMVWEVWRYFDHGWIARYFVEPEFHFTYFGFDWVRPWSETGMYLHFWGLGVLGLCLTVGLWYRLAATLFFFAFTYIFLLEEARYLNHFYLIALVSLLLIFVPAHGALSLDARRMPGPRATTAPAWALWVLRAQIAIAYVYGGIAKIGVDWLAGEPMRFWLADRTDFPIIGTYFTLEWVVYVFAYGGLLFDLFVIPLLLWPPTWPYAVVAMVLFHVTNAFMFQIGVFPWFMLATTLILFTPGWPRLARASRPVDPHEGAARAAFTPTLPLSMRQWMTVGALAVYMAVQLLVPLRHLLYPGSVNWTEEGHRFSWHMKLRDKDARALFYATLGDTGEVHVIDPSDYMRSWQWRKLAAHPDMILQFGHHVEAMWQAEGYRDVEVRAEALSSLNSRRPQLLVDPTVDLTTVPRTLGHAAWIMPLTEPLPARSRSGDDSGTGVRR